MDHQSDVSQIGNGLPAAVGRAAMLSHSTVSAAIALLTQRHGISDEAAFHVLRDVSQRHNVRLRSIAAAVLRANEAARPTVSPPALTFSARARARQPNRTDVLIDLMTAAMRLAGTTHATVQIRDCLHGGLRIEGHRGFDRDFLDFFAYIDDGSTSCGFALEAQRQIAVDDVARSPAFGRPEEQMLLASGVRSVLSTPLLDERGTVRGIVSTHHELPGRLPPDSCSRAVQQLAAECARWLNWYDRTVMPAVVRTVHAAAARAAEADAPVPDDLGVIVVARRMLMDHFGIGAAEAASLLVRLAADRGVPIVTFARGLAHGC